mmetsp:Transcript_22567/g.32495  ORF Transcript_22567/g.32495 Transcript_22567/m.32495 type:complete len:200 (-) Transcript_22567:137-736(-)
MSPSCSQFAFVNNGRSTSFASCGWANSTLEISSFCILELAALASDNSCNFKEYSFTTSTCTRSLRSLDSLFWNFLTDFFVVALTSPFARKAFILLLRSPAGNSRSLIICLTTPMRLFLAWVSFAKRLRVVMIRSTLSPKSCDISMSIFDTSAAANQIVSSTSITTNPVPYPTTLVSMMIRKQPMTETSNKVIHLKRKQS